MDSYVQGIIMMITACVYMCTQVEPTTAPVQKPPIPQEHMWLVQGLDGMVERCKKAATSGVSIAVN